MRRLLSSARFLALLLPLYFIFVTVQVGCGGAVARDDGGLVEPAPGSRGSSGGGGGGGGGTTAGGCDDSNGCDYGGYSGYYGGYGGYGGFYGYGGYYGP